MTDKELLELAAKAAGIKPTINAVGWPAWTTGHGSGCFAWNPLEDDGDALRLAVRLPAINVSYIIMAALQQSELEPCAYVRREITKAAAEIGRML